MVFDGVQFTPLRKRAPPAVWHIATCHLQTVCLSEAPPTSPTFKPCELKACIENSNKRRAVEQAHDAAIWETWQLCLDGVSPNSVQGTRNLDRPPQNTDSTSHLYWPLPRLSPIPARFTSPRRGIPHLVPKQRRRHANCCKTKVDKNALFGTKSSGVAALAQADWPHGWQHHASCARNHAVYVRACVSLPSI